MTTLAEPPQRVPTAVPVVAVRVPVAEVTVAEELTGPGLQRLRERLDDALARRPREVVVDLAGCARLDVEALHVLLEAHARAFRGGARLSLRSLSPAHARTLALAGLHTVLHVVPAACPPGEPGSAPVHRASRHRPAL